MLTSSSLSWSWTAALLVLSVVFGVAHAADRGHANDSVFYSAFISRNCPCPSPIHPQALFCSADLVVSGRLVKVESRETNCSIRTNSRWTYVSSCTELTFHVARVLHTANQMRRKQNYRRAVREVRRSNQVVLTIPKSQMSTCNFNFRPRIGSRYVISASFLDDAWYTFACYHLFEHWESLTVHQRKAYALDLYEQGCDCQIVQNTSVSLVEWPRRAGETPGSQQCWWQPGSESRTTSYDRLAFCSRTITRHTATNTYTTSRCKWRMLENRHSAGRNIMSMSSSGNATRPQSPAKRGRNNLYGSTRQASKTTTTTTATTTTALSNEIPLFG